MLKPITNWSDLQRALRARGKQIVHCVDCGHVRIVDALEMPPRCTNAECKAWANSPKRDSVGRPAKAD